MSDLERLHAWMAANKLTVWELAREMGVSRHTVYFAIVRRKKISGEFVRNFIRRYGMEEGGKIFIEHFALAEAIA